MLTDRVELTVPADPAYLAVLRTASAGLAARMDLTLDEIEDLRIAVDEACALLLRRGTEGDGHGEDGPDDVLTATFSIDADVLEVHVRGPGTSLPERSSFAWAVLEALAGEVESASDGGKCVIVLRHRRSRRES